MKGEEAGGSAVEFGGAGPRFTERLAEAVFGGQVVLSEPAWAAIQDQLPGNAQALALLLINMTAVLTALACSHAHG